MIQDFPKGHQPQRGGENLLFGIIFAENCMKMKKMDLEEVRISHDPPPTCNDIAHSKYQSVVLILHIGGFIEAATRIRKFAKFFYFQKIPYPL